MNLRELLRIEDEEKRIDYTVVVVLVSVAIILTLIEYLGLPWKFAKFFPGFYGENPEIGELYAYIYWSLCSTLGYFVIPSLLIFFVFKKKLSDFGLSPPGFKHFKVYLFLYSLVLPGIILASFMPEFQHTYPFYKGARENLSAFVIFEFFYLIQFFALEFFFRGYFIFSLEKRFQYYSVFIMVIPYCMIHYHKPLPEALAAIVAGIVLGFLALKTRTIWWGVAIHYSVALSMDLISLAQGGKLF